MTEFVPEIEQMLLVPGQKFTAKITKPTTPGLDEHYFDIDEGDERGDIGRVVGLPPICKL